MESLEKDKSLWEEAKSRVTIKLKQSIRPELFNRFDGIVVFSPHTLDGLANITVLLLTELAQRVSEQNIALEWTDTIPMLIASKANEPGLGARPLRRYIQDKIEGKIATEILEQKLKAGSTVKIKESWII
jgi:ATP-dependent Clp protease ATP-binding subunit ClpA